MQEALGVDVNIGAQWDKVYILPNYQNSYAGGNTADMFQVHLAGRTSGRMEGA